MYTRAYPYLPLVRIVVWKVYEPPLAVLQWLRLVVAYDGADHLRI